MDQTPETHRRSSPDRPADSAISAVGFQRDLSELLRRLVDLELDAVDSCYDALARLDDASLCARVAAYAGDRSRCGAGLGDHLRRRGVDPPVAVDAMRLLAEGRLVVGGPLEDRTLLAALRSQAHDTARAYERALARDDLSPSLRELFEGSRLGARRQHEWLHQQIALAPPRDDRSAG